MRIDFLRRVCYTVLIFTKAEADMEYHSIITRRMESTRELTYGVLSGDSTLVFIKSGRGSDHRGYQDKYVQMAHRIHEATGYTVICAPNPMDAESYGTDETVIRTYAQEAGWDSFDLRLFGGSNGGYQILLLGERMAETSRILCVNMPLMINYHKVTRALGGLARVEKTFVYGTNDPSISYLPFLESKKLPNSRVLRIEGADHRFEGRLEEYIALINLLR